MDVCVYMCVCVYTQRFIRTNEKLQESLVKCTTIDNEIKRLELGAEQMRVHAQKLQQHLHSAKHQYHTLTCASKWKTRTFQLKIQV